MFKTAWAIWGRALYKNFLTLKCYTNLLRNCISLFVDSSPALWEEGKRAHSLTWTDVSDGVSIFNISSNAIINLFGSPLRVTYTSPRRS